MHRCLLISEILCNILEFTQQYEESLSKDGCKDSEGRKLRKQTLASLAQTCHAFSSPALDQLWMCLESLDPLIKLLPRSLWENPICYTITVVRMIRTKKHQWLPFRQYATRVRFLHGPSSFRRIPLRDQHVVTALARSRKVSLPLLPNLTELVWDDRYSVSESTMTMSLVKFFASPKLTSLSLFLPCWPSKPAKLAALYNLPRLCPNVTSFTTILQGSDTNPDVIAPYLVDVIRRWPHLQVLETSALCPWVTTALASKPAVHTLNKVAASVFHTQNIGNVPNGIQTLTLGAYGTRECLLCLKTLQGSPVRFHLQIHCEHLNESEMGTIFQELSQRLDFAQLRFLTIELTTPSYCPPPGSSSLLTEPLLFPLHSFSALHTLDLSSFRASHLDDAAYERVVAPWPELRCLKLGTTDAWKWWPAASVRAVIAVLRSCPHLQTLHIVFNGSIPPPCPTMNDEEASERVEDGKDERAEVGQVNRWGVSNAHITQIHVGHSPIGVDIAGLKGLATCLGSVMPRLRTIQSEKELSNLAGRWRMVQDMLVRGDAVGLEVGCVT